MATAADTTTANTQADQLKQAIGNNEYVNKARAFAKERPFASAALAGVLGIALINTLRGR